MLFVAPGFALSELVGNLEADRDGCELILVQESRNSIARPWIYSANRSSSGRMLPEARAAVKGPDRWLCKGFVLFVALGSVAVK